MSNAAVEFYNSSDSNYLLPILSAKNGNVQAENLAVPTHGLFLGDELPQSLVTELGDNIERLYSSVKPVTVKQGGVDYTFEIGYLPAQQPSECSNPITVMRSATYQCSLSGKISNGFEVALDATLQPRHSVAYVSSIGMGLSSPLTLKESIYLAKHGTLLKTEDNVVTPLPVISAFAKALVKRDIDVSGLYSDSAGAVLNVAYGATHGAGSIKTAHQNVRTGYWDISAPILAKGMIYDDNKISKAFAETSPDAFRMRTKIEDFTHNHLGSEYLERNYKAGKSARMLASYAFGLGKGPNRGDPLVADNIALVRANPDIDILFTTGSLDPLATNPNLPMRMRKIVQAISSSGGNKVMAAILEGTSHSTQTHYPQFLRAISVAALGNK